MYKKRMITVVNIFFMISIVIAQDLDLEKTYSICKDVKKGFLGDVKFDNANGNYQLSYLTTSLKKNFGLEHYLFDKDFNFLKIEHEELEFDNTNDQYSWWKGKGEDQSFEGITIDSNLSGSFILRKIRLNFNHIHIFSSSLLKI